MKTYKKTINVPRLKIWQDDYPESPREWNNLGYFISVSSRYHSPDKNDTLYNIVKETGEYAKDQADHMELIRKEIEEQTDEKVVDIFPITTYEHGSISYSLGTKHGFDNSNNSFYIVTDKTLEEYGECSDMESRIYDELEIYNSYGNGNVWRYTLYDEKGEEIDNCGGFYRMEELEQHLRETLGKEWENENFSEYVVNKF